MYYVDNGVTYNTLRRLKPDSTEKDKEDETLYGSLLTSVHCLSLRLHGGKVFFCTKPKTSEEGDLMYYDTATGKTAKIKNTSAILFTADDTALYFYNAKDGSLCAYTFATGEVRTVTEGVTAQSIAVLNGSIYWIDTTDGSAGLYTVKCDGSGKKCIETGTFSGVFSVSSGIVYYEMQAMLEQDYPVTTGKGHFCYRATGAATATTVV